MSRIPIRLPNTGREVLACGTPVVASATCGLGDIDDDRVISGRAERLWAPQAI